MILPNAETMALRGFLILFALILFSGCGGAKIRQEPEEPPRYPAAEMIKEDRKYTIDAYDPWEGFNRRMYIFNAKFDRYVFLPVVSGYEFITPVFVQNRVSNVFNNLHEIRNLINSLLQFKGVKFFTTVYRVAINSTVGVLGLFDPATPLGLNRQDEDFGQTLGVYGMGSGPYLVLPILGPSTLRDTGGLVVDNVAYTIMVNELIDELDMSDSSEDALTYTLAVLRPIDTRHQVKFRYYETGSPFEYDLVRMLFLKKREFQIAN
jgi:phospholipid-binding lipoprotein MlaA